MRATAVQSLAPRRCASYCICTGSRNRRTKRYDARRKGMSADPVLVVLFGHAWLLSLSSGAQS
jgi:hypothetical protein